MRLKELRAKKDVSQEEVAAAVGLTSRTYQNYEYGQREPNIATLIKLADYYNVSVDYLIGREPKNETIKQLAAEFALTETEQKLLTNYIGLNDAQKDTFNKYVTDVAKQLINGITAEIKQATVEPIKAAASTPTESQILRMGDKQPRELTEEEAKHVDFSQKPYFMTE